MYRSLFRSHLVFIVGLVLAGSCGSTEDRIDSILQVHEAEWNRCSAIKSKIDEHNQEASKWLGESPLRVSQEAAIASQHSKRFDDCWNGWTKAVRLHFKETGLTEEDFERAVKERANATERRP